MQPRRPTTARAVLLLVLASCGGADPPAPAEPPRVEAAECGDAETFALLEQARAACAAAHGDPAAWGRYGCSLIAAGAFRYASSCFARAGELDPARYEWAYLRGRALAGEDDEAALAALARAAELEPSDPAVQYHLANACSRLGRTAAARE